MAEGLFYPNQLKYPKNFDLEHILFSIVKVIPDRTLEFQVFKTKEESESWSSWFEEDERGFETMKVGFSEEDLKKVNDPSFSNQLFVHEFCELYKQGQTFPVKVKLKGSATGVFISKDGHIATNFHMASGIIEASGLSRNGYLRGVPIPAPSIKIEILSGINDKGELIYKKVDNVFLAGSYSKKDAYGNKLDLAILKVDSKPTRCLDIATERVKHLDKVYNIGFTMRTARPSERKDMFKYEDGCYDLRISSGLIIKNEENQFLSDCDGGPGNSGSATLDVDGRLVGIYCGSTGNGIVSTDGIYRRHCHADLLDRIL